MAQTYRFGDFELDMDAQQLRHGGESLKLERLPFDLLVLLVIRHGRLVSRDEIVAALWPNNVVIDFESGLNTAVRKVRRALGDSADEPRFFETVPGRGYRFIAPVTEPAAAVPPAPQPRATKRLPLLRATGFFLLAAMIVIGIAAVWRNMDPGTAQTRIAILPFENLTGDESLGYVASGIAEEINLSLARIELPNLVVIGVVSTTAAARSDMSLQTIGSELGADFVVLSSLRMNESRIRVTSRLLRAADGEQVWSASFDRELTNLLGLQRELSVAIAEQIRQELSPDVAAAIDRRQTQNPEAYELYLKGRHEWTRFQPDSVSRALQYYEEAVDRDPTYGLAWAGIAHALITSTVTVDASRQAMMSESRDALQRALEYGPDLAEAQLALGSFHGFLEGDLLSAESAARRAVALDPNCAMCQMFLGMVLSLQDRHIEARAMMRRARELDPLFPLLFANSSFVALRAGQVEEALELATQAIAINPEFWVGYLHRGAARVKLGDYEGALEAFDEAERLAGNTSINVTGNRAYVLALMGREAEARDILEDLLARAAERHVSAFVIAYVHVGLGEFDAAFDWLERGLASGEIQCVSMQTDHRLEPLRADFRFETLLRRCMDGRETALIR